LWWEDVYFYLHMGCCMVSRSNLLAQRKDVEEYRMYTPEPNMAVDAWHYIDYVSKWVWTWCRWSTKHTLQFEPYGHGTWQSPTGLKGSCTLSRQCTIYHKCLIRATSSDLTAIGTRWHLLVTSLSLSCFCHYKAPMKALKPYSRWRMISSIPMISGQTRSTSCCVHQIRYLKAHISVSDESYNQ
jgi:hypothetical protein